jgi:hypothetical protein
MAVVDVFTQNRPLWARLREKGGRRPRGGPHPHKARLIAWIIADDGVQPTVYDK